MRMNLRLVRFDRLPCTTFQCFAFGSYVNQRLMNLISVFIDNELIWGVRQSVEGKSFAQLSRTCSMDWLSIVAQVYAIRVGFIFLGFWINFRCNLQTPWHVAREWGTLYVCGVWKEASVEWKWKWGTAQLAQAAKWPCQILHKWKRRYWFSWQSVWVADWSELLAGESEWA